MKLRLLIEEFTKNRITFYELSSKREEGDGFKYVKEKLGDEIRFISDSKTKKVFAFNRKDLHYRSAFALDIPYPDDLFDRDVRYFFGIGSIKENKLKDADDIYLNTVLGDLSYDLQSEGLKAISEEQIKYFQKLRKELNNHPSFIDLNSYKSKIDNLFREIEKLKESE